MVREEQSEGQRNVKMVGLRKRSNAAATGDEEEEHQRAAASVVERGRHCRVVGRLNLVMSRGEG